jgi:hypothetical protein
MEFTVEAIVNPSRIGDGSATDYHAVAFSRSGAGATAFGYILYLHGDSFEARIADGTTVIPVSVPATATADGGPYYLAMSYDGATLTLYVNHVDTPGPPDQQASAAAGYAANVTSDLLLGASNFPGPGERFFFPGVITDVAVYNVALSSDTVRSHFSVLMTGTA